MKIAVYTIAKNEEQFVERWAESCKEADFRLIVDTGSTDNTLLKAAVMGIDVHSISISPWRFDDARNAALALLPDNIDYCISLDMDEVLVAGWRQALEDIKPETTRPRYQYTWSWNGDKPGLQYGGDKIHRRHGYRWKHPVHEVLVTDRLEEVQEWISLEIHHFPDNDKPRSQYLPLLAQAVVEDPHDDRNAFYYARELYYYGQYQDAAKEFRRHLSLPTAVWVPERAASLRYLAKCEPSSAESCLLKAIKEAPGRREALVELAFLFYTQERWHLCLHNAIEAIAIAEKPLDYLCEEFAWGALPYDLAAISAYNIGDIEQAKFYGQKAVEANPSDPRLASNLLWYTSN
jgi:tetratricopeptide (TPR) repeat protein